MKSRTKNLIFDLMFIVAGGVIWSAAINVFTLPNSIVPGGFTGIATILYDFFGLPVGTVTLVMNIPLFLISWKVLGKNFLIKTGLALIITSALIDAGFFLPEYTGDPLLASVFGGLLSGIGLGMIYMRGIATGGVDIIARLLERPLPFISYGKLLIGCDVIIAVTAGIVYKDISAVLYASIVIFFTGGISDRLINGVDRAKLVYIITDDKEQLADKILQTINRGVTIINGTGAYTGDAHHVLMVVIRPYELHRLRAIVRNEDRNAFIIIGDVSEVVGEGFKDKKSEL